jgi:predicted dehydrogenase
VNARPDGLPASVAIAGAWGYIGRKFLDVALARGLRTYVYDPGPAPVDMDVGALTRVADEAAFYRLPADLFHLALHPEHRRLDLLLARREPLLILNEKPMALPEQPQDCRRIVAAVAAGSAIVLYDFPELFDPLTARVLGHLAGFRAVRITGLVVQRSKDREDPGLSRNFRRMVPIQYQETVHCLAYVLYVLAAVHGGVPAVLDGGVVLTGESESYMPPNPQAYPYPVDGRCRFAGSIGGVPVEGLTDFKRGAPWVKRRVIRGVGDGASFTIDVSYLEGRKSLRIDGVEQPCDPRSNSYEHVLRTATRWAQECDRSQVMHGLFPNPQFTQVAYQLSAALWRSCRDQREVALGSAEALESFDAGFLGDGARS